MAIMQVSQTIISWVATMSPQEREDFYLVLAEGAADRGDINEEEQWLEHAVNKSSWQVHDFNNHKPDHWRV